MMNVLPMIMDALIICLLSGTIFFAARLSHHIKVFRESREEMEGLLANLSSQITKAEQAIDGLRANARESGRDLQSVINEGRAQSEELQILIQSGDRLASRIEKISGETLTAQSDHSSPRVPADKSETPSYKNPEHHIPRQKPMSGFVIRDPEFEEDPNEQMDEQGLMPDDYQDNEDQTFTSRAEKDLYEALKSKGKARTGAGGIS
jgi:hypothetical protein